MNPASNDNRVRLDNATRDRVCALAAEAQLPPAEMARLLIRGGLACLDQNPAGLSLMALSGREPAQAGGLRH